ncbi:hypothetical protein V6N00_06790 [Tersicoccus sp. MR15.9]|uniref:hypothetical protein n=1 Tax=Tersicoccus mangrovi TaxID=3121635 RepID=UPI002FE62617
MSAAPRPFATSAPPFGLLLDVDGPIANTVTRTIAVPGIATDLAALGNAGVPVVFNTGRSANFLWREVVPPLRDAGLDPRARVHAVGEKGGTWFSFIEPDDAVHVDPSVQLPPVVAALVRPLLEGRSGAHMFLDETKLAMVSLEQSTAVSNDAYLRVQPDFEAELLAALTHEGIGWIHEVYDRRFHPDEHGATPVRVEPTIISTDIQHERSGKALGAERALALLGEDGAMPRRWYTVGDTPSDYAMADWLHEHGHDVVHVDVRPVPRRDEPPYPVDLVDDLEPDVATARFLAARVAEV